MGFGHAASPAREGRRAREGARRASELWSARAWVCLVGLGVACSRQPQAVLSLDAPLPEQFSSSTTLELGDPTVQRQLELTGALGALPFEVNWQNISGGPLTILGLRDPQALGVGTPRPDDEASAQGVPALRARRYPTRLERTA